ncbi:MAG: hypothetical protein CYPHOPRED_003259 [Cyphobasidiales sp. Tagirdzhanova-0007]|nr:MAG: hypothetical protein CYPHOPRED_003259 [Cyphobasidiales sp. Tagirdzhanova-0007]
MAASWADVLSLIVIATLFFGCIGGFVYMTESAKKAVADKEGELNAKGITLTPTGIAIKTDKQAPTREEIIESQQRAFLKGGEALTRPGVISAGGKATFQDERQTVPSAFQGENEEQRKARFSVIYFNPEIYRIVLFDQRGSGKSKPDSELEENTTWALVDDMEKIRKHLQIKRWHVFGGSWGSTLALAYAQKHPGPIVSMTLRGIFTLRRSELEFLYQGPGTNNYFPEYWDEYLAVIPADERGDIMAAYHKRLTGPQPERSKAALAWTKWEMATSRLHIDNNMVAKADDGTS